MAEWDDDGGTGCAFPKSQFNSSLVGGLFNQDDRFNAATELTLDVSSVDLTPFKINVTPELVEIVGQIWGLMPDRIGKPVPNFFDRWTFPNNHEFMRTLTIKGL